MAMEKSSHGPELLVREESSLHVTVRTGCEKEVREKLVETGDINVNTRNFKGETPLHLVSTPRHNNIIKLLVAFGANVFIVKNEICKDVVEVVINLIYQCDGWIKGPPLNDGDTPLHAAARQGELKTVKEMIKQKRIDVNHLNSNHETPLHLACAHGHKHIVHILLSNGANMYTVDSYNNAPIHRAMSNGHTDIAKELITTYACNPMIKGYQGRTLLHFACSLGNTELIRTLIQEHNNDPNAGDSISLYPLHIAALYGHYEVCSLLITEYGCSVHCHNSNNQTPLHLAFFNGHFETVEKLISRHNACLHIMDDQNCTPINLAAISGHHKLVKHFIRDASRSIGTEIRDVDSHREIGQTKPSCRIHPLRFDDAGNTTLHRKLYNYYLTHHECASELEISNDLHCHRLIEDIKNLICSNNYHINFMNYNGQTPLSLACSYGNLKVMEILITKFNASIKIRDIHNNDLLHVAVMYGYQEIVECLIRNYHHTVNNKNCSGKTPLHLACMGKNLDIVKVLIMEFNADVNVRDNHQNTPLHSATRVGDISIITALLSNSDCDLMSRGFKGQTVLHQSVAHGHVELSKFLIEKCNMLLFSTDNNGNTPLHIASDGGHDTCIKMLLYDYHAPLFARNKAGKTAMTLSNNKAVFREYMDTQVHHIQATYQELHSMSLKKYSGKEPITRIYVLGNAGSGKSTLIESFKRKGVLGHASRFQTVKEEDIETHTAGIVPSVYESKKAGRIIYYDFAGDREYYSSHSAILERVTRSQHGSDIFFVVLNLCKGIDVLKNELGYWLSFVSYNKQTVTMNSSIQIFIVCSHADQIHLTIKQSKIDTLVKLYTEYCQIHHFVQINEIFSINCCKPLSAREVKKAMKSKLKGAPLCSLSFLAILLHGLLEKDFTAVTSCKLQDILDHINATHIPLPTTAETLYPIAVELHDVGLLMIIGKGEDALENHQLIINLSSITNEVHERLFSQSTKDKLLSKLHSLQYYEIGILTEDCLQELFPEYITKDCLIQLQYCQEYSHADVRHDYFVANVRTARKLYYFPALCNLDKEKGDWHPDPALDFYIGWYARCMGKFDFFPPRYLHVLLLRLSFMYALPVNHALDLSTQNYHCTMWKNGIHWVMREGVECIVEVVNENKGVIVVVKSRKQHTYQCIHMLTQIVNVVIETKTEFCNSVSLRHYILNSNNPSSYSDEDILYDVNLIKSAIEDEDVVVRSVSGHQTLTLDILKLLKCHPCWSFYFSMKASTVLQYIEEVVEEWEVLGLALQLPNHIIKDINFDEPNIDSKRRELIRRWMNSPELCGPACWWLLVKALEDDIVKMNALAARIRADFSSIIALQEKLLDPQYSNQKPDDVFLRSFAEVVGNHWPSLASLLSLSPSDIGQIKTEKERVSQAKQALYMLRKWNSRENASYGHLLESLKTVPLFRC